MNNIGTEFVVEVNGMDVKLSNISVDGNSGNIQLDYEVLDKNAKYCRTELEQAVNTLINGALARFVAQHLKQEVTDNGTE